MGKYFKFIGVIEIIGWVIGIIPLLIYLVGLIGAASKSGGALFIFLYVLAIACYVFFGPAVGLAFYALGNLVDNK